MTNAKCQMPKKPAFAIWHWSFVTLPAPLHKLAEIDAAPLLQQGLEEIARLLEARANVVDAKILDAYRGVDLCPADRGRDARARMGADRVDRRERPSPGVLVVVDEHALLRTLRHAILRGHQRRVAPCELLRQRFGERPHLFLQDPAHNGDKNFDALGSVGLA